MGGTLSNMFTSGVLGMPDPHAGWQVLRTQCVSYVPDRNRVMNFERQWFVIAESCQNHLVISVDAWRTPIVSESSVQSVGLFWVCAPDRLACFHTEGDGKLSGIVSSSKLKELFLPLGSGIPAILVPPGARLLIRDIPTDRQLEWHVPGGTQKAVFTILTDEANTFRDAIGFGNGTVVLLCRLVEGQRVRVLSVSSEEEKQLIPEFGITMQMN